MCVFFLVMKIVDGFTIGDCFNVCEGKGVQIYCLSDGVTWSGMVEIGLLKVL